MADDNKIRFSVEGDVSQAEKAYSQLENLAAQRLTRIGELSATESAKLVQQFEKALAGSTGALIQIAQAEEKAIASTLAAEQAAEKQQESLYKQRVDAAVRELDRMLKAYEKETSSILSLEQKQNQGALRLFDQQLAAYEASEARKAKAAEKAAQDEQRLATQKANAILKEAQREEKEYQQSLARQVAETEKIRKQQEKAAKDLADVAIREAKRAEDLAEQQLKQLDEKSKQTFDQIKSKAIDLAQQVGQALGTASLAVSAGIIAASGKSLQNFGDFDQNLKKIQATTSVTREQLKLLSDTALQIGKDTQFSSEQAAQGLVVFAKAGDSVNDILNEARGSALLAVAGSLELKDAAEITSSSLKAYGKDASYSAELTDRLSAAANSSAVDIRDIAESLKYVAPYAVATNQDISDLLALISATGDRFIKSGDAGTDFANVLSRLSGANSTARKELARLQITVEDSTGKFLPLKTIIDEIKTKLEGATDAQKLFTVQQLAGQENGKSLLAILNLTNEQWAKYKSAQDNASGSAQKYNDIVRQGVTPATENLKGSVETASIAFGEALAPSILPVIVNLTELVNKVTDFISNNKKVVAEVTIAAGVLTGLFGAALLAITSQMAATVIQLGALALGIEGVGVILTASIPVIGLAIAAFVSLANAVRIASNEYDAWRKNQAREAQTAQLDGFILAADTAKKKIKDLQDQIAKSTDPAFIVSASVELDRQQFLLKDAIKNINGYRAAYNAAQPKPVEADKPKPFEIPKAPVGLGSPVSEAETDAQKEAKRKKVVDAQKAAIEDSIRLQIAASKESVSIIQGQYDQEKALGDANADDTLLRLQKAQLAESRLKVEQYQRELGIAQLNAKERSRIEAELATAQSELKIKARQFDLEVQTKSLVEEKAIRDQQRKDTQAGYDQEIQNLQDKARLEQTINKNTTTETDRQIVELKKKKIDSQIEGINEELALQKEGSSKSLELQRQLSDLKLQAVQLEKEQTFKELDERQRKEDALAKAAIERQKTASLAAINLLRNQQDLEDQLKTQGNAKKLLKENAFRQQELTAQKNYYAQQLALIRGNNAEQEALRADLNSKIADLDSQIKFILGNNDMIANQARIDQTFQTANTIAETMIALGKDTGLTALESAGVVIQSLIAVAQAAIAILSVFDFGNAIRLITAISGAYSAISKLDSAKSTVSSIGASSGLRGGSSSGGSGGSATSGSGLLSSSGNSSGAQTVYTTNIQNTFGDFNANVTGFPENLDRVLSKFKKEIVSDVIREVQAKVGSPLTSPASV